VTGRPSAVALRAPVGAFLNPSSAVDVMKTFAGAAWESGSTAWRTRSRSSCSLAVLDTGRDRRRRPPWSEDCEATSTSRAAKCAPSRSRRRVRA